MNDLFSDVNPVIIAVLLGIGMIAGWSVGFWRGRTCRTISQEEPSGKMSDAVLALLGLLLAFTFSMSLQKHDQRRQMVVTDASSIGDFYTCASLLKSPHREQLQTVVRRYAEQRAAIARTAVDDASLQRTISDAIAMQQQMQSLVAQAIEAGTPTVVPLINTFNAVTSSQVARLAAAHDRLPSSIVVLLLLASLLSITLVGWQHGQSTRSHPIATAAFITLVCMVVCVILDLNQPQHGWITVSQEPMQRVVSGMSP